MALPEENPVYGPFFGVMGAAAAIIFSGKPTNSNIFEKSIFSFVAGTEQGYNLFLVMCHGLKQQAATMKVRACVIVEPVLVRVDGLFRVMSRGIDDGIGHFDPRGKSEIFSVSHVWFAYFSTYGR